MISQTLIARILIAQVLITLAFLSPQAALAQSPKNAAEFDRLPALGKLVEGGVEKDTRFRTYLVGKRPSSTGAIEIFIGQIHMRVQDISGGPQRRPSIRKWTYAARCSGDANTIGVHTQSIAPREKAQTYFSIMPGVQPDPADLTWYNVWYAVCLDDFNKYPRTQEK